jgi:Tol biopolymer transport system component
MVITYITSPKIGTNLLRCIKCRRWEVFLKVIEGVDSFVAISPDGKRTAFNENTRRTAIIVANADGTEEEKIAVRQSPEMFMSATWSPDGKKLACVGQRRDGERRYGDLIEIGIAGRAQTPITDRRWAWIDHVVWLSDGSGLMMTAIEKTDGSELLWHISYPGGEARRVTSDLNDYSGLSMTKDSSAIVTKQRIGVYNLYIQANGDAAGAKQITSGSARGDGWSGISWTPDGKIIYSSAANGTPEIWSMEPDGSNQKQLTVDLGSNNRGLSVSARWPLYCFHFTPLRRPTGL